MRCLFISYDGLTDPLGRSQIIPYLSRLAGVHEIRVLSFEKPERFARFHGEVKQILHRHGIGWHPQVFSRGYRLLAKPWDLLKMYLASFWLAWRYRIQLLHCRSYPAAQAAQPVKALLGTKVLFDIRGFWVDERVDNGNWKLTSLRDRLLFGCYKWLEVRLLKNSDHIVSLSQAAVPQLCRWLEPERRPITVIPCCADFQHFRIDPIARVSQRASLGLREEQLVLVYVGGLGGWYRFPEMLRLFGLLLALRPDSRFLIVTQDWNSEAEAEVARVAPDLRALLIPVAASRDEVPAYLAAADLAVSFISPSFSKIASSPTKLAEYWACGLPVISNTGVGDVAQLTESLEGGYLVDDLQRLELPLETLERLLNCDGEALRQRALEVLSLKVADERYNSVYSSLDF